MNYKYIFYIELIIHSDFKSLNKKRFLRYNVNQKALLNFYTLCSCLNGGLTPSINPKPGSLASLKHINVKDIYNLFKVTFLIKDNFHYQNILKGKMTNGYCMVMLLKQTIGHNGFG